MIESSGVIVHVRYSSHGWWVAAGACLGPFSTWEGALDLAEEQYDFIRRAGGLAQLIFSAPWDMSTEGARARSMLARQAVKGQLD